MAVVERVAQSPTSTGSHAKEHRLCNRRRHRHQHPGAAGPALPHTGTRTWAERWVARPVGQRSKTHWVQRGGAHEREECRSGGAGQKGQAIHQGVVQGGGPGGRARGRGAATGGGGRRLNVQRCVCSHPCRCLQTTADRMAECQAALERKAQLYAKLGEPPRRRGGLQRRRALNTHTADGPSRC